jgi:hypothetical protein
MVKAKSIGLVVGDGVLDKWLAVTCLCREKFGKLREHRGLKRELMFLQSVKIVL